MSKKLILTMLLIFISLNMYSYTYVNNGVACTTYWGEYTTCLKHDRQTITVNESYWMLSHMKNSFRLQNTIAHEFGHILGLDHSDHVYGYVDGYNWKIKVYDAILMGGVSFNRGRHLTEDDKYGVRSIYGKDDQDLKGDAIEETSSSSSYGSRTGYSITHNLDKDIFKYLWIEE